jgi:hypothetical protein
MAFALTKELRENLLLLVDSILRSRLKSTNVNISICWECFGEECSDEY